MYKVQKFQGYNVILYNILLRIRTPIRVKSKCPEADWTLAKWLLMADLYLLRISAGFCVGIWILFICGVYIPVWYELFSERLCEREPWIDVSQKDGLIVCTFRWSEACLYHKMVWNLEPISCTCILSSIQFTATWQKVREIATILCII